MVAVLGLGKSGKAAVKLLSLTQSRIKVYDRVKVDIDDIKNLTVGVYFGNNVDNLFKDVKLVVVSPGLDKNDIAYCAAKRKNLPIISEIELAYRFLVAKREPFFIAITGTNGKSTTTKLISDILSRLDIKNIACGNIGIAFSDEVYKILKEEKENLPIFCIEVSSFQLRHIEKFKPNIAVFLNFSPDHLDNHTDILDYFNTKANLFKNQTKEDFAILNFDNPMIRELKEKIKSQVIFFSKERPCEISICDSFVMYKNKKMIEALNFKGLEVENLMGALGAILAYFKTQLKDELLEKIQKAVNSFKKEEHRLEIIGEFNGILFVNDSKATNPASTINAILQFDKNPIILLLGGRDKNLDFSMLLPYLKGRVKKIIGFGEAREKIKENLQPSGIVYTTENLSSAIESAVKEAKSGDVVLLSPACSSFDKFKNYKERGEFFKKRVFDLIRCTKLKK